MAAPVQTTIKVLSIQGFVNPLITTLKLKSKGPSCSNMVIGTLAVGGWAVTFGTARRGLGGLHQMYQPTHQRPMYQHCIIPCGTIISFGV